MGKLFILLITFLLCFTSTQAFANRGCCSWHGGVNGCDREVGRLVCNDGMYSPSCGCEKRNPFIVKNGINTIPDNSELNNYKDGWVCKRGYVQHGNICVEIVIPANGKLNYLGDGWECNKGFRRHYNECVEIVIPANGKLKQAPPSTDTGDKTHMPKKNIYKYVDEKGVMHFTTMP